MSHDIRWTCKSWMIYILTHGCEHMRERIDTCRARVIKFQHWFNLIFPH